MRTRQERHVADTTRAGHRSFGSSDRVQREEKCRSQLTDDGAAYVELMTGTFSNNRPITVGSRPHGKRCQTLLVSVAGY